MKRLGVFGLFLVMAGTWGWGVPSDIQVKAAVPAGDPVPGNLVVGLTLSGKDLKEVKGLRCILEKAVDDTGKNLLEKAAGLTATNQNWTLIVYDPKVPVAMQLPLDLPAAGAAAVKELSGRLEILTPVHDPLCLLSFSNLAAQLDRELSDPNLKAAQIKIKVTMTKKRGKPCVEVQDPLSKLIYLEIVDVQNKEWTVLPSITSNGTSRTYIYAGSLPEGASLRACVPTPKSILSVPLNLKNIALPQKKGQ